MRRRKVLVCPAHYLLDDRSHGSEYAWPVGLMRACGADGQIEFVAIAGNVGPGVSIPGTRLVSLGLDLASSGTIVGMARFVFLYARESVDVIRFWKPDVIHHLLPFRAGATFNPVILGRPRARTMVGPVQAAHRVPLDDERGVAVGNYRQQEGRATERRPLGMRMAEVVARHLSTLTLARADTVLAANQAGQDTACRAGAARATIVPFGVDTVRFSPRARRGISRSVTTFLVVAYLMSRKRVVDVLHALAIVASRGRNVRLRIVGDGPQLEMLIALAGTLCLDGVCEFVGRVPHERVAAEYNIADVVVSASASETFGMSLLEAMACGLPVISATNDGAVGIVQHGRTGYQFSVGDVNGLAARMDEMCADASLVRTMGVAALEHVVQTYGWNVVAARLRDLYKQ